MINNNSKQKGSSILMILAISMVIIILSGVATSAMLFTTKGNKMEKIDEDLLYSAEGGTEVAFSLIRKYMIGTTILSATPIQAETNNKVIELKTKTVHSVEVIIQEITASNRIRIISTAYGYKNDGTTIDMNNKKIVEKIIVKSAPPSSAKIFENSMVAEKNIDIDIMGGGSLGTTQITGGEDISLPGSLSASDRPIIKPDTIQSTIFKPIGTNPITAIPNIRKQTTDVVVNYISWGGGATDISLLSKATELNADGSTVVPNGVGKLKIPAFNIGTSVAVYYEVILVNADRLVIKPSASLNETATIVICSGDIEIETSDATNTLSRCTLFGKNVKSTKPGALFMNASPAPYRAPVTPMPVYSQDLTTAQSDEIDKVVSKYIENWGGTTGGAGGGAVEKWQEVKKETIYK